MKLEMNQLTNLNEEAGQKMLSAKSFSVFVQHSSDHCYGTSNRWTCRFSPFLCSQLQMSRRFLSGSNLSLYLSRMIQSSLLSFKIITICIGISHWIFNLLISSTFFFINIRDATQQRIIKLSWNIRLDISIFSWSVNFRQGSFHEIPPDQRIH